MTRHEDMINRTFHKDGTYKDFHEEVAEDIPKTSLAADVQASLGKADTAYQKPSGGIPVTDLAEGVLLPNQPASEASTIAALKTEFNTLLEALKTAGLMEADPEQPEE